MKTKHITLLFAGMLLVSGMSAQEGGRTVPDVRQVKSMKLATHPTAWQITFYPNGAVKFGFGDAAAAAPKGSASLGEVYSLLVPRLEQRGSSSRDISVFFYVAGDEPARAWHLPQTEENKEIVRTLTSGLLGKIVPIHTPLAAKGDIQKALAAHPFLAGDRLASVVIPGYDEKTAFAVAADTVDWQKEEEDIRVLARRLRDADGTPISPEEVERIVAKEFARERARYGLPPEIPVQPTAENAPVAAEKKEDGPPEKGAAQTPPPPSRL